MTSPYILEKPMPLHVPFSHAHLFDPQEPALMVIRGRLAHALELAFDKAVAHLHNSRDYPLPSSVASIECAWWRLLSNLPRRKQKQTVEMFLPRVKAGAEEREQLYGPLAAVNLRSATGVLAQVRSLPGPVLPAPTGNLWSALEQRLQAAVARKQSVPPQGGTARVHGPPFPKLELRFLSMLCGKDTGAELGRDEMSVTGVASDGIGTLQQVPEFNLGKFKSGANQLYNPPHVFHAFSLDEEFLLDREFSLDLLLMEKDWFLISKEKKEPGGLGELIGSLIDGVAASPEVQKFVEDLVKAAVAGGLAGLLAALGIGVATGGLSWAALLAAIEGALITMLVAALLGALAGLVKHLIEHEVYTRARPAITLAPLTQPVAEPLVLGQHRIEYTDYRSQYVLTYDWRLVP